MTVPRALLLSAALVAACPTAPALRAADAASEPAPARVGAAELVTALSEYRATLMKLLPLQESDLERAIRRRDERRGLVKDGIISRKEYEETLATVERLQQKVEDTRRAIVGADQALAEATTVRALAGLRPLGPGGFEQSAELIRYNGIGAWSLKPGTAKLQEYFAGRFGRPLPISSYGQTPLHHRMGFDHKDALDVAVHPDSAEGRELMVHMREAGIPFIASWGAVPGSTSGAHIHVGQPSPRIVAKP